MTRSASRLLLALVVATGCTGASVATVTPPSLTAAPIDSASSPSPDGLADLHITAADVVLYPGPVLYSGDLVSFDVTPQDVGAIDPRLVTVRIYRHTPDGLDSLAYGAAGYPALEAVPRIRITWAWDTTGLEGEQVLRVELDPDDAIVEGDENPANNVVRLTVRIRPAGARPQTELAASWATTGTRCCVLHYLTGTAAERDLERLVSAVEGGVADAEAGLGVTYDRPLEIYFIDRVIGHGGYVQNGMALSYLDRRYVAYDMETVIRHETVHLVDDGLMDDLAPAIVREGLAVWIAGGHVRPEPIPERAAALLELGRYVPLDRLADDFYSQQHEAGYLEAAALVAFLVDTYGWDGFLGFYANFDRSIESPHGMLNTALLGSFGTGLAATEEGFQDWLLAHPPTAEQVRDVQIAIRLFEAVRRYQRTYEPGAYFLSGWLVDPVEAESRGIVADLMRHPRAVGNVALETMLLAAHNTLVAGDHAGAEAYLDGVDDVLDGGDLGPAASQHLALVATAAARGYEVQSVELEGDTAWMLAIADPPSLVQLRATRTVTGWVVLD